MKTDELTGTALDWAVAKCEGLECTEDMGLLVVEGADGYYSPSIKWAQGGAIIEREKISIEHLYGAGDAGADVWVATRVEGSSISEEQGSTALIAAMRCYVASKLGDEVELPEELA
jgi:hypothetical protein